MDPFETRLQFLSLLRRLNASQQSIQKAVSFAVKFFECSEDLWDCIVEEIQKGSINSRLNMMYFLDSLCEACLTNKQALQEELYLPHLTKDLPNIIQHVIPPGREGLPNLISTKQILENWRNKSLIDPPILDSILADLSTRQLPPEDDEPSPERKKEKKEREHHQHHHHHHHRHRDRDKKALPHHEIFRRIEEDRERHKRLREKRWVLPTTNSNTNTHPLLWGGAQLYSFLPLGEDDPTKPATTPELPIDVEFEKDWDTVSDWNEDDDDRCREENALCYWNEPLNMDIS